MLMLLVPVRNFVVQVRLAELCPDNACVTSFAEQSAIFIQTVHSAADSPVLGPFSCYTHTTNFALGP